MRSAVTRHPTGSPAGASRAACVIAPPHFGGYSSRASAPGSACLLCIIAETVGYVSPCPLPQGGGRCVPVQPAAARPGECGPAARDLHQVRPGAAPGILCHTLLTYPALLPQPGLWAPGATWVLLLSGGCVLLLSSAVALPQPTKSPQPERLLAPVPGPCPAASSPSRSSDASRWPAPARRWAPQS